MIQGDRDSVEVEALLTDHYLDGLLSARDDGPVPASAFGSAMTGLDRGVRIASLRLQRDLPRFRPSFRFEERLGLRLAEAANVLRGSAGASSATPVPGDPEAAAELARLVPGGTAHDAGWGSLADMDTRALIRPALIGGAVASAAVSIAAAALVARRRRQRRGHGGAIVSQLVGRGRILGELVD